jgi:hypothetical protein
VGKIGNLGLRKGIKTREPASRQKDCIQTMPEDSELNRHFSISSEINEEEPLRDEESYQVIQI